MKEVQLAGGTSETEDSFVGGERELRVDTSNQELRLHDGVTPGGHKIPNRDSNDERYQARSVELDGLTNFPAAGRGFPVRVGPSNYKLRQITVNGANLQIVNGNGVVGNPLIGLADEITSEHNWTAIQTFESQIEGEGGFLGDTIGLHTGPVVGDVTGDLTGNAAGDHTGSFEGDLNTAGHNVVMGDGQILLAWLESAITDLFITRGVSYGMIMAWSGDESDIPDSYVLCDGNNGTPDLRDKFILGAGPTYAPQVNGGSDAGTATGTTESGGSHTHDVTIAGHTLTEAEMPTHKHGNGVCDAGHDVFNHGDFAAVPAAADSIDNNHNAGVNEGWSTSVGGGQAHDHDGSETAASGAHTHEINLTGIDLPPYWALCYVMKGV